MNDKEYENDWGIAPPKSESKISPTINDSDYQKDWAGAISEEKKPEEPFYPDQKPMGAYNRAVDIAGRFNKDVESIPGKIGNKIVSVLNAAPSEIAGAASQEHNLETRGRAGLNVLKSYLDTEKSIRNIPSTLAKYAGHLGVISKETAEKVPEARELTGATVLNTLLGKEQPGDKLLQETANLIPLIKPAAELGAASIGKITGTPGRKALMAKLGIGEKEKSAQELESIAQQKEAARDVSAEKELTSTEALENAKATLDKVKEESQAKNLPTSVGATQGKIAEHEANLGEIKNNMKALNHQMDNLEPIPEYKPSTEPHVDNTAEAANNVKQAQESLSAANIGHQAAEHMVGQAEQNIGHYLNPGADYAVNTSRLMRHRLEGIEAEASNNYRHMMNNLRQTNFQLRNPETVRRIDQLVQDATRNFGDDPGGYFATAIREAPRYNTLNAADYMNAQKSFRDAVYNLYERARNEGHAGRRAEMFRAVDALRPFEQVVNDVLEQGLGEHLPAYTDAMRLYREQVYPLREDPVAQKIRDRKPLSDNIAKEFSGDEPAKIILREIANPNPEINRSRGLPGEQRGNAEIPAINNEIQRNIIGQQYHKRNGANNIYNAGERLREYMNNMPELNRLLTHRENTLATTQEARQAIDRATVRHQEALAAEKEAAAQAKASKETARKLEEKKYKEHTEKVKAIETAESKLQKQLGEHHDKAKKIEKELPALKDNYAKLEAEAKKTEEAAQAKKVNLLEHKKLKNEAKIARQKANEAKKKHEDAMKELQKVHFGIVKLTKFMGKMWTAAKKPFSS